MSSPYVNDLVWLMEGHFIENDLDLSIYWQADWREKLQALAQQPKPLEEAVNACKSHFLGSYFEVLFSYAIRHFSSLTILLEHQQIVEQGKTLGEVDMLVETPDGALLQFEIAIKFYLQRPDLYPEHWIGPNKNDSLHRKVTRARAHQLTIMDTKSAKEQWKSLTKGRPITACLLIYGRLFLSLNEAPQRLQQIAKTGFGGWIYASQASQLVADFALVRKVNKPHWLSLSGFYQDYTPFTSDSVKTWSEAFDKDARPLYLCLAQRAENIDVSYKYSVFVVPDSW
ncbi:DUF1853 family protein [Marinomonas pollencensis]|uniref:DUF1853 family protein n=1 Tax=Marinomonas pollencensis TaxID=491954 RepID=A0A3E0DVB8_9GAMM|nr:DUF1853 family protein [Marinomonas pollencensis]REG86474.1 hypothetical protein DFP81_10137 [Marinomonas pollencensis]